MPPTPPAPWAELAQFLTTGPSLLVATRDEQMTPELVRCGAARLSVDGLLRVALAMPEGVCALANIQASGVIALTAALPTTYRTYQVTGRDARVVDWPEHEQLAQAHIAVFVTELSRVGIAEDIALASWSKRYVSIAFTPEQIYDQTPGPRAGLSMVP